MRYEELALIYEKRARAQYEKRARAFNKKVKPRNLKEGDLVLKVLRDETFDPRGKMKSRWFGPFIIKKIMSKVLQESQIWIGKRYFAPLTWIDSRNTTYKRKRKKKKKPTRLKTRKDGLDKN